MSEKCGLKKRHHGRKWPFTAPARRTERVPGRVQGRGRGAHPVLPRLAQAALLHLGATATSGDAGGTWGVTIGCEGHADSICSEASPPTDDVPRAGQQRERCHEQPQARTSSGMYSSRSSSGGSRSKSSSITSSSSPAGRLRGTYSPPGGAGRLPPTPAAAGFISAGLGALPPFLLQLVHLWMSWWLSHLQGRGRSRSLEPTRLKALELWLSAMRRTPQFLIM